MAKLIKSKYKNKVLVAGGETAGIPYGAEGWYTSFPRPDICTAC